MLKQVQRVEIMPKQSALTVKVTSLSFTENL